MEKVFEQSVLAGDINRAAVNEGQPPASDEESLLGGYGKNYFRVCKIKDRFDQYWLVFVSNPPKVISDFFSHTKHHETKM